MVIRWDGSAINSAMIKVNRVMTSHRGDDTQRVARATLCSPLLSDTWASASRYKYLDGTPLPRVRALHGATAHWIRILGVYF